MFRFLIVLCSLASVASAADELSAQFVKTGLFLISGGGCNSLLRLSGNGLILVDGKLPGNYEGILRQAAKLSYSDQPIRALIVTDARPGNNGNNAQFRAGGTQIVAQENIKNAVAATITYRDKYTIRMGGVEAQLLHFGSAPGNGDTVVYFPNLKVVALGDLYASEGNRAERSFALEQVLKLDFDVAVPGNGPMVGRAEVEALKKKIDAPLPAQGVSDDERAVRAVIEQETEAWKNYDAAKVAELYTADAIWQNPFGVRLHGSAALKRFLTNLFNRPGYRAGKDTSEATVQDLRFPAPTVAVVWGEESSEGQINDATGKPMLPRHSHYLEVLVKTDGRWRISECLIMDEIRLS